MSQPLYHDPHLGEVRPHPHRRDTVVASALLTPKHVVPCRIDVPGLSSPEETEDVIREAGELFALIRRDEWAYRLALAGEFLALMARHGAQGHAAEQELAEMAPDAVARECWMVEVRFS